MSAVEADCRRLTLTRHYNAPRELVWQVWTDPRHVAAWWGPFGPDQTQAKIEMKVGGDFFASMTAPDGTEHPCRGTIREVDPPNRLVIEGDSHAPDACGAGLPPGAVVIISFTDQSEGTRLTLDAIFPSESALAAANESGYSQSWNAALDLLVPFIESLSLTP